MASTLDSNFFKKQFTEIHNLIMSLVKQLEQQQSSISTKKTDVMKETPIMKKKPKNRRQKKDMMDDDMSFLDSVVAKNKKEYEANIDIAEKVVELYRKRSAMI